MSWLLPLMIAVFVTTQVLAFVTRQTAACVLMYVDGRLAEDAEKRPIAALRQTLRLIAFLRRAVVTTVLTLIDAHLRRRFLVVFGDAVMPFDMVGAEQKTAVLALNEVVESSRADVAILDATCAVVVVPILSNVAHIS